MNDIVLPDIVDIRNQIFYDIWKLVDDKYILFSDKSIDWNEIRLLYEKSLNQIETYESLFEYIDQMLLELRDPHTRIIYSPHISDLGIMPLALNCINGDYYINKSLIDSKLSTGSRLLSIDGIPIKEVELGIFNKYRFQSLSANITAFLREFSIGNLGHCLKIKATANLGNEIEDSIYFQSIDSNIFEGTNVERMTENISLCQIREFEYTVGYIKIINFRNKKVVKDFIDAITYLNTKKTLIIDIRGNDGGFIKVASDLVAFLTKHEIDLGYKVQRKQGGKYDEYEEPANIIIRPTDSSVLYEKIVILCDEFTMSSAEFIFLSALKNAEDKITVVGKKTGGLPYGASVFTLFDGTKVQITTSKYLDLEGNVIAKDGIIPHFEIHNSEQLLTEDKDHQLEFALKLCQG